MSEQQILVSVVNNVATITLNRPKKGNALTATMNEQLLDILPKLASNPQVRVLVLTGAGKYFCTGMDLSASLEVDSILKPSRRVSKKGSKFSILYTDFPSQ
ncbi:unnamed protein product [Absidia cylindrospora]